MRCKLIENILFHCRINIFKNNMKIICTQVDLMKEVEAFDS